MKIKQILSISTVVLFALLSLTSCSDKNNANTTTSQEAVSSNTEITVSETTSISNSINTEWKTFLSEYEEWTDNYIELIKKYQENPTDTSLLTDYNEMAKQAIEWSEKAEKLTDTLKESLSTEDLKEYNNHLSKIVEKLNKAIN